MITQPWTMVTGMMPHSVVESIAYSYRASVFGAQLTQVALCLCCVLCLNRISNPIRPRGHLARPGDDVGTETSAAPRQARPACTNAHFAIGAHEHDTAPGQNGPCLCNLALLRLPSSSVAHAFEAAAGTISAAAQTESLTSSPAMLAGTSA